MDSGGGGGSGGSILICAGELHAATGSVVTARGGRGGLPGHLNTLDAKISPAFSTAGGCGGVGRIHALVAAGGFQGEVLPQPLLTNAPQPRVIERAAATNMQLPAHGLEQQPFTRARGTIALE